MRSCFFRSGYEEATVAYEVGSYCLKIVPACRVGASLFALGRLERGDEVALEEVGAGGEGYGV